jgi:hypothetical protein
MFYKIYWKLLTLKVWKVHHYVFRRLWSSSGVKMIAWGSSCLLLLVLLIYKSSHCAYVFELVVCVLSSCVLCCVSRSLHSDLFGCRYFICVYAYNLVFCDKQHITSLFLNIWQHISPQDVMIFSEERVKKHARTLQSFHLLLWSPQKNAYRE